MTERDIVKRGKPVFIIALINLFKRYRNVIKLVNTAIRTRDPDLNLLNDYFATLRDMFYVLGLDITYVKFDDSISTLYKEYLQSKENKDFAKSDEIRKVLIEKGVM